MYSSAIVSVKIESWMNPRQNEREKYNWNTVFVCEQPIDVPYELNLLFFFLRYHGRLGMYQAHFFPHTHTHIPRNHFHKIEIIFFQDFEFAPMLNIKWMVKSKEKKSKVLSPALLLLLTSRTAHCRIVKNTDAFCVFFLFYFFSSLNVRNFNDFRLNL